MAEVLEESSKGISSTFIDEAIGALSQTPEKELGSILSTLNKCTSFLSNPVISEFFKEPREGDNELDIRDYLIGNVDMFLIIPEQEMEQYPQLISLFANLIRVGFRLINQSKKHHRYLWLLDEVGQGGYLEFIEKTYEINRRDGVRQHLFLQGMEQLDKYDKKNMLKNFTVQRYFRTTEIDTINHITFLSGKQTITQVSETESKKSSTKDKASKSETVSKTSVDLITVDKITNLPEDEQIIFFKGQVILCKKIIYYKDAKYKGKDTINYCYEGNTHLIKPYIEPLSEKSVQKDNLQKDIKSFFRKLIKEEKNKDNPETLIKKEGKYYINFDEIVDLIQKNIKDVTDCNSQIEKLMNKEFFILTEFDDGNLIEINVKNKKKE